jgi:hypothetical protein
MAGTCFSHAFLDYLDKGTPCVVSYISDMRRVILGLVLLLTMGDSCNNNVVGVQDYGTVTGRVLDATTNGPIADAIVSVGSLYVSTADARGGFTIPHVPIGLQQVTARMPGFTTVTTQVRIKKDQTTQAGFLRIVPLTKPDSIPTLPPPATPTPEASVIPTYVPPGYTPSPAPTASPAAAVTPAAPATATASPTP